MSKTPSKYQRRGFQIWFPYQDQLSDQFEMSDREMKAALHDAFMNCGGSALARNLIHICVTLPIVQNDFLSSSHYRGTINRLRAIAEKKPEWFTEETWGSAFEHVLDTMEQKIQEEELNADNQAGDQYETAPQTFPEPEEARQPPAFSTPAASFQAEPVPTQQPTETRGQGSAQESKEKEMANRFGSF